MWFRKNESKGFMMGCLNFNSFNRYIDEIKVFLVNNCFDILDIKEIKFNGFFCDE